MKKIYRIVQACFLVFSVIVLLTACTQVTEENFNKVQTGMTMSQVTIILGPPTSTESVGFMGFSGTTAVWKNQNVEITIIFFDDKVQIKGLKQIEVKNPFPPKSNIVNTIT